MVKIFTDTENICKPSIEKEKLEVFFKGRAKRINTIGPVRAVIYQDKHPDLAERRDRAEKEKIMPLMKINQKNRVLDIGCGTGRWANILSKNVEHYHGIDFNADFINYSMENFKNIPSMKFTVASAENFNLEILKEKYGFDLILCFGVLIYLNDDDVFKLFDSIKLVAKNKCRVIIREPFAIENRLTIINHFSEDMDQEYNAIYRTYDEFKEMFSRSSLNPGFEIVDHGNVYEPELRLNNRAETIQQWLILERK